MTASRSAASLIPLLAVLAACATAPGGATAGSMMAADGKQASSPPGWSVRCENDGNGLNCKAVKTLVLASTRQLLLSVAVSRPPGGDSAAILLQLPHGLYNPAGVTIGADASEPKTLPIQTCDIKGCFAGTVLTNQDLAALRKGETFKVIFQDLKRQNITVQVPLKGFEAAYKKL